MADPSSRRRNDAQQAAGVLYGIYLVIPQFH